VCLAAFVPLAIWLASVVLRVESPDGTLVVKIHDQDLVVSVANDKKITVHDKSTRRTFSMAGRKGEIHVYDETGQRLLVTKQFEVRNGETTTLEVTLAEIETPPPQPVWRSLFNGKDLAGWKHHPDLPGDWKAANGVLVGTGRHGWLFSERGDYGDFHLRAEFQASPKCDSGIFFWTPFELKRFPDGVLNPLSWHEANIFDDGTVNRTGSLDGQGLMEGVIEPPSTANAWQTLEIVARGRKVIGKVNGKVVAEITYPTAQRGRFALQAPIPIGATISFRKIEVKEPTP